MTGLRPTSFFPIDNGDSQNPEDDRVERMLQFLFGRGSPIGNQGAAPLASEPIPRELCELVPLTGNYKTAVDAIPLAEPVVAEKIRRALDTLNAKGIVPTLTDGFRTPEMQTARRSAASSGRSKYPAAGGVSSHQVGMGHDFGLNSNAPNNAAIRKAMTEQGLSNGAEFNDPVHYYVPEFRDHRSPEWVASCLDAYRRWKGK